MSLGRASERANERTCIGVENGATNGRAKGKPPPSPPSLERPEKMLYLSVICAKGIFLNYRPTVSTSLSSSSFQRDSDALIGQFCYLGRPVDIIHNGR